jgi:sulfoxide reductase catalytic subunit YedY
MNSELNSEVALAAQLTKASDTVDIHTFAGGLPQERGTMPQIRLGSRWFSTAQILTVLVPAGFVGLLVLIATAQQLRLMSGVQAFIAKYPGTGSFATPVVDGFPWWLRYQHFLNFFLLLFMIRSGVQILAEHPRLYLDPDCTPGREWFRCRGPVPTDRVWTAKDDCVALPGWLGLPGIRHSIGLARMWHFSLDTLWLANGLIFYVLLFSTHQWHRLVPQSWDVFPNALSTALQYASLTFPPASGWQQFNALQMLVYFATVFIAPGLAMLTGMLQAPAIAARFHLAKGPLNRQVMRTVHFGVLAYFVIFLVVHVSMVFSTGLLRKLNEITRGVSDNSWGGLGLFALGMGVVVLCWIGASPFTLRFPRLVQRIGETLTGWLKIPLERLNPLSKFKDEDISPHFWSNGKLPDTAEYQALRAGKFVDYKLKIGGLVEHPQTISFAALQALPKSEQITQHYCIQGWSGVAKWGGVPMATIMEMVRPKPGVRYAVFYSFSHGPGAHEGLYYDVHKLEHMAHPNTILAYEMNGQLLPELHGAPLRLRNEVELGYKQIKWVQAVEFVENYADLGASEGGFSEDHEFYDVHAPI